MTTNTFRTWNHIYQHEKVHEKIDQGEYHLQQKVGLTVKEFQGKLPNLENISMISYNSETSMGENQQEGCSNKYGGC